MTEQDQLIDCLPCPFCGCEDIGLTNVGCERGDGYIVNCEDCGAEGPFAADGQLAAQEKWNRRVT